jgi:hypothetical protein
MRVILPILAGLAALAAVSAQAGPSLTKSGLVEVGAAHLAELIAEGCGPGWHWSQRKYWNWLHCALDWRPAWGQAASVPRRYRLF